MSLYFHLGADAGAALAALVACTTPQLAKAQPSSTFDARAMAAQIVQDACETDPGDPTHPDTLIISTEDLETIVRTALENKDCGQ